MYGAPRAFRHNRPLQLMLGWLLLLWLAMAIEPFNRRDWLLENLLVFAYAVVLTATYRRFAFSNLSYFLFTVFMSLHLVGAHYTYAEAPFGFWLQQGLDLSRNHFDRIVHFAYGLLCATAFHEVLLRAARVCVSWSYFLAVVGILAFSAFYEVMEAIVAELVSPELGVAFLGAQGDGWDAQKDTFLAMLGATISMSVTRLVAGRRRN